MLINLSLSSVFHGLPKHHNGLPKHQSPPDRGNCHGATCAAGGWAALGGEDLVAAAFSAGRMILGGDANARVARLATYVVTVGPTKATCGWLPDPTDGLNHLLKASCVGGF